ncbi:hypothetical protein NKG99_24160 [Mesorhizobium sp. M1409]|uniref:hypothetical protein n=1 Tax=unclassified Mesorhizobium TaxID=325217 RepID=UPI00333D6581
MRSSAVMRLIARSRRSLSRFSTDWRHMRGSADIRAALESAGVEFIPENGGGAGVRLRKT